MCGIAGYCLNTPVKPSLEQLERFWAAIRRRGPDDEGAALILRSENIFRSYRHEQTYKSLVDLPPVREAQGFKHDIALLHTRYAILDLSAKGHQPYVSQNKSIIGVFNGEIYNYLELRDELSALGCVFQTRCDTEVLVEGYAMWKDNLWNKLNGFWSVVLYDARSKSLIICRDRVGVAPLYYRQTPKGLFFSSYIEPLLDIEGQQATLNQEAISGFLDTGYKDIDGSTFYKEIKTVPQAAAFHLSASQSNLLEAQAKPYWYLPDSRIKENDLSIDQAVKQFSTIFMNAVELRMRADVKVAFELSGGLDSSSVVAAAASFSPGRVTTYTAKVKGAEDETYARSMLQRYNIDYCVIDKMEDNFAHDCVSFGQLMEEPYDNPNAYTHYQLLSRMKAQGAKVVITGAGGDEVFAGYESSFWPKAWREWQREGMQAWLRADWYETCRRFRTPKNSYRTLGHYIMDPFRRFLSHQVSIDSHSSPIALLKADYGRLSFNEQRAFHFKKALLPYYMRSSDHFTMGIPIEHRFPLLDWRLIEFGLQLPIGYLFRNGWTKYILRKAMEPFLPSAIVWRRQKQGFLFPFYRYLSEHRKDFEGRLKIVFPKLSYIEGLKDPAGLWRYISTAIWLQERGKIDHRFSG